MLYASGTRETGERYLPSIVKTAKDTGLQTYQIHNLSHTWFVPNRETLHKKGSIDTMTRIPWQLFLVVVKV